MESVDLEMSEQRMMITGGSFLALVFESDFGHDGHTINVILGAQLFPGLRKWEFVPVEKSHKCTERERGCDECLTRRLCVAFVGFNIIFEFDNGGGIFLR